MNQPPPTPPSSPLPTEQVEPGNPDQLLIDRLRSQIFTPRTVRSVFLMLTRLHWSDPENYGLAKVKLGKLVWHREATARTLHIDLDYNYDVNSKSPRPAIFVGTNDYLFSKVAMDNRETLSEDNADDNYIKIAATQVIVRHLGTTPDETLEMADLTSQFFLGMRKLIQERLNVYAFEVARLITARPFDRNPAQADQQFMADLIMDLQYSQAWTITREGHRLKRVTVQQVMQEFEARPYGQAST